MMLQDPNLPIPGSTCHKIAQWIIDAQKNISTETICNAWRKTGFSYSPTLRTPKIKLRECVIDSCNPFLSKHYLLINLLNNQFH